MCTSHVLLKRLHFLHLCRRGSSATLVRIELLLLIQGDEPIDNFFLMRRTEIRFLVVIRDRLSGLDFLLAGGVINVSIVDVGWLVIKRLLRDEVAVVAHDEVRLANLLAELSGLRSAIVGNAVGREGLLCQRLVSWHILTVRKLILPRLGHALLLSQFAGLGLCLIIDDRLVVAVLVGAHILCRFRAHREARRFEIGLLEVRVGLLDSALGLDSHVVGGCSALRGIVQMEMTCA